MKSVQVNSSETLRQQKGKKEKENSTSKPCNTDKKATTKCWNVHHGIFPLPLNPNTPTTVRRKQVTHLICLQKKTRRDLQQDFVDSKEKMTVVNY